MFCTPNRWALTERLRVIALFHNTMTTSREVIISSEIQDIMEENNRILFVSADHTVFECFKSAYYVEGTYLEGEPIVSFESLDYGIMWWRKLNDKG